MKKIIALSVALLMVSLAVLSASPFPLMLIASQGYLLGIDPTVSAITAYADEHKREIYATLLNDLEIAQDITVVPNVKNKIALPKLTIGNGFRPYSATEEIKTGQVTFADRYLEVALGKREIELDLRALQGKHLAWRTSPGSKASKTFADLDFAPFVWNEITKTLRSEINDEVAYFGFNKADANAYSALAAYGIGDYVTFTVSGITEYFMCIDPTTPGDSPASEPDMWQNVTARAVVPGLKYRIDNAVLNEGFTETNCGTISSGATAVTAFKTLFRAMPTPYKNSGVIIHASYTDCEWLMDGQSDTYKYTQADISMNGGAIQLFGANGKCWVKPATWLGDSRRLIAEPMRPGTMMGMNLVMGTDLLSDMNDIKFKEKLWTTKLGISLAVGFEIQDLNALRINDIEDVIDPTATTTLAPTTTAAPTTTEP